MASSDAILTQMLARLDSLQVAQQTVQAKVSHCEIDLRCLPEFFEYFI